MKRVFLGFLLILTLFSLSLKAQEENAIIACDNSLEMFAWDLEFIRHAKHTIEFSICFGGGTIIREMFGEIEARLEVCPELQVYVLTTPILFEKEDKKILARLEKNYPDRFHLQHATNVLVVWPDVTGVDNHVKMLVVDGTYFSAGGTNLDQSLCSEGTFTPPRNTNKPPPMGNSLPAGARDQDVVGRGPIAENLRKSFYKLYGLWEYYNKTLELQKDPEAFANGPHFRPLDSIERPFVSLFETDENLIHLKEGEVRHLLSGCHQNKNVITYEYVKLINEAKDEILIGNLYFSPVDPIYEALLKAVNRGVKLTVITNGVTDRSPEYNQFFCWANRMTYTPMFYGKKFHFWDAFSCSKQPLKKTKIYEYYVKDVLYHKKIMIVDSKKFIIGSYNLGVKSDMSDYEQVLVFNSKAAALKAKKVFSRDLCFSLEVSPKKAREWYFDPFISYMGEIQRKFHGLI